MDLSVEKVQAENGRERRTRKEVGVLYPSRRTLALPPVLIMRAPAAAKEVKLAAVAVDLNVRLRSADMSAAMQERAFRYTRALLDDATPNNRPNPSHLAMSLKKEFDASYGPAWHCIVGKSFGSFVTHAAGGFLYFSIDKLSFLLFKTEVRPIIKSPPLVKFDKK